MVALDIVHASNARLKELGPGLVALFVGGTSGIGEYTAKAFVRNSVSPHVYIVGRNQDAAERIIKECEALNKDAKVEFIKADVSELAEVDRVCSEIVRREKRVNLLVQSQGNLNLRGRDESPEGIDRKFTLNYYSRMRFITNLLPHLHTASTQPPHLSRSLSILAAGHGSALNLSDLELKHSFSTAKCAGHSTMMNDIMVAEFAQREPATTFSHSFPSIVMTGITRELPLWARAVVRVSKRLLVPFTVGVEETGARQLFMATSGIYPPLKPFEGAAFAGGFPPQEGMEVARGGSGKVGGGAYSVDWNCDVVGEGQVLSEYRSNGISKTVWEHTMGLFERVEKINQERASVK